MIRSMSELLNRLREHENEVLKRENITHRPTIGDMYEGLTRELLDKSFPSSASINVVGGFICDSTDKISKELDCMVVTGEGQQIPHTDKYKYNIDNVIAVIQVKKNLYSTDLKSGYENLLSFNDFIPATSNRFVMLQDAFQGITKRPLPARDELDSLPWSIQIIYHTLLLESIRPARIIIGYNGFKTQSALRDSFSRFLADQVTHVPAKGYGLASFPSLICCGEHCLVKANGMPISSTIDDNGFWYAFCSTTTNPIRLLLEIIWTRLVYDKIISSSVFDDGDYTEPLLRYIDAKPPNDKDIPGWIFKIVGLPKEEVNSPTEEPTKWEPVFLDKTQWIVMNVLCDSDEINLSDISFQDFLHGNGYTVDKLIEGLNQAGLAARSGESLVLLTRGCSCAILPDGRFAAGENISNQFTRWMSEYMNNRSTTIE